MFKSILPSRRIPSGEFQMVTPPLDAAPNGKENYPELWTNDDGKTPRNEKSKRRKGKDQVQVLEGSAANHAFEKLLDELQVPDNMRAKLATMDPGVKAQFVKHSKDLATMSAKPVAPPATLQGLRKARSIESIATPEPQRKHIQAMRDLSKAPDRPKFFQQAHNRGVSFDANRQMLQYHENPEPAAKSVKDKHSKNAMAPSKFQKVLSRVSTIQLDIELVKKLRLHLRNEPASWTQEFVEQGGYDAMLSRLYEILSVEWREEQHDDQILHELLRCFKALATSAVGCAALRSYCPAPYAQLVSLLYSDKRPGDVATRNLILDLLLGLFDLYPPSALPSAGNPLAAMPFAPYGHSRSQSVPWETEADASMATGIVVLPAPHASVVSLVKSLLLTPAPPSAEDNGIHVEPHIFIEQIRRPRIYKTYLEELSNLIRDFFWVYCHPGNSIWNLEETDEAKAERPRAPGGMSGGVEFEAMGYMATHFRFLNAMSRAAEDVHVPRHNPLSAYQFHSDLFASGMDRILVMARKASTTYYPVLHLEIARYLRFAARSGIDIPWGISRLVGPPPSNLKKPVLKEPVLASTTPRKGSLSVPSSPTKKSGYAPGRSGGEPGARRVTPMFGF